MGPTLQMFEDTKEKFEGKMTDTKKHETDDLHEYMMIRQDLVRQEEKALRDTRNTKDADTNFLADTNATCKSQADTFEQRQELRKEEIEALNKAIEILGGTPKSFAEMSRIPGAAGAICTPGTGSRSRS